MRVAIFHDWLVNYGGAERVIESLNEIYPSVPVYTSVFLPDKLPSTFKKMKVHTSFLQKIPTVAKNYQKYLFLMPFAFENFKTDDFDVVLSSSHSCAKGILTRPSTLHICYCYTPPRYIWDFYHLYMNKLGKVSRYAGYVMMNYLRVWDFCAAQRVDHFIAISKTVANRILKYYRRESEVIYPPVDTSFFTPAQGKTADDYYLVVSRLVPYKRVDIVIDAFNELKDKSLKVIGNGSEYNVLKRMKKSNNIEFINDDYISDEKMRNYYRNCKALIFTAEEDFGIVPVEAQACGKPVIAYKAGGATETIIDGKTGCFFFSQTKEAIIEVIRMFESKTWNKEQIRENALLFDKRVFQDKIKKLIQEKYEEFKIHKKDFNS